jgi:hypothetical protein
MFKKLFIAAAAAVSFVKTSGPTNFHEFWPQTSAASTELAVRLTFRHSARRRNCVHGAAFH